MKYFEWAYWYLYAVSVTGTIVYDYLPFAIGTSCVIGTSALTLTLLVLNAKKNNG